MSVDSLEMLQGGSLPTLHNIRSSDFLCWERKIAVGYISKKLNEGMLHSCQEAVQFSSISTVIPHPNSLAMS
jgi:hypothetical protein